MAHYDDIDAIWIRTPGNQIGLNKTLEKLLKESFYGVLPEQKSTVVKFTFAFVNM